MFFIVCYLFFIVFVILFIGFPYFSSFSEAIPQELSKTGFWLFLHDCAKCSKKIGKSGRPKVLNLLLRLRHMWKRWFWGAALHFFGINVPGCAVLVFRGSPQQVVFKKISRPRNVSLFFALNVYIIQWPEPLCADIAIFWAVLWPCAIFTLLYFPGLFWIYNSMTGKERKMKGKRKKDERNRNGRGKEGRGKEEEKERKRKVWTVPK